MATPSGHAQAGGVHAAHERKEALLHRGSEAPPQVRGAPSCTVKPTTGTKAQHISRGALVFLGLQARPKRLVGYPHKAAMGQVPLFN